MWLLNTHDGKLKEFIGDSTPAYAILSHRWKTPDEEVGREDWQNSSKAHTTGHKKICRFLEQAQKAGVEWAWVDTCCIDYKSSAELSEAINSMWTYYSRARTCFVYLADTAREWQSSDWWDRGWTLQELLAPKDVHFYNAQWQELGTKHGLSKEIHEKTKIPISLLEGGRTFTTVAQKLSWAAGRKTTRVEDRAYSLLGLLDINMPLLYGEGRRAFQRLQLCVLEQRPDQSILAWPGLGAPHRILASSPDAFADCSTLRLWRRHELARRETPLKSTSWGIKVKADLYKLTPRNVLLADDSTIKPCWAFPLTITRHRTNYGLHCTLVLVEHGHSRQSFRRIAALSGDINSTLKMLRKDFDVGALETRTLYLDFYRPRI